jgi:hypothetical protein
VQGRVLLLPGAPLPYPVLGNRTYKLNVNRFTTALYTRTLAMSSTKCVSYVKSKDGEPRTWNVKRAVPALSVGEGYCVLRETCCVLKKQFKYG